MKSPIAALALCQLAGSQPRLGLKLKLTHLAFGSQPSRGRRSLTRDARTAENRVVNAGSRTPGLDPGERSQTADAGRCPHEPIEPYLLSKENGPFMVLARIFRGPDAERMALALVKELRNDYKLPAYILRTKDFPGKSLIRGTPPTVPSNVMAPDVKMPEKIRTFDEAAVLVGNEKTMADSEKLWREVKKIKPKCLKGMSSPFLWRQGLSSALRTTNPYVPAQLLYPAYQDRLMVQMNSGLRSIVNCPGHYSLQIAEFSGRSDVSVEPAMQPARHFAQSEGKPAPHGPRRRGTNGRKAGQGRRIPAVGTADLCPPRPDVQPGFRRFVRLRARSPGRRASRAAFADGRAARWTNRAKDAARTPSTR